MTEKRRGMGEILAIPHAGCKKRHEIATDILFVLFCFVWSENINSLRMKAAVEVHCIC